MTKPLEKQRPFLQRFESKAKDRELEQRKMKDAHHVTDHDAELISHWDKPGVVPLAYVKMPNAVGHLHLKAT
jgi:hypothetical protein